MSCISCTRKFSFLRPEKSCPVCGFGLCSKCVNNKVFVPKLNCEKKVCAKCKKNVEQKIDEKQVIIPPDVYYKRLAATEGKSVQNAAGGTPSLSTETMSIDEQIQARLKKLKEDKAKVASEEEIAKRLQEVKGVPSTSDADISNRLAKLKGVPVVINNPVLPIKDLRTEQEQADDLIKQYSEQSQIDTKYKNEFDSLIGDIESRIKNLKGGNTSAGEAHAAGTGINAPSQDKKESPGLPIIDVRTEQEQADDLLKQYTKQSQIDTKYKNEFDSFIGDIESRMKNFKGGNTSSAKEAHASGTGSNAPSQVVESEDEEESVRKILEKIKAEASAEENEISINSPSSTYDELPFCEICNEDATMRCRGCHYLYCKSCFLEHKDVEDGCYEYTVLSRQPKGSQY